MRFFQRRRRKKERKRRSIPSFSFSLSLSPPLSASSSSSLLSRTHAPPSTCSHQRYSCSLSLARSLALSPCETQNRENRHETASLKPDLFEGLRFDFTKPFNQNFALCHSFFMGNVEVPSQSGGAYKMAVGTYEFGANLVSQRGDMMIGRVLTDGRLTGRVKKDLLENGRLSAKVQAQLSPESSGAGSQVMLDLDSRGSDWNGEFFIYPFFF